MGEGALDGVLVVDLTIARSGPTCVRQLVDLGAQAIQVRPPDSAEMLPGSDGWNLHRGKRSIFLDLRSESGRADFLRLVERADVVVENFRPSVKHRLRIAPEDLWPLNPGLIYASISGFGQDGPYAERPGVDQIAQGLGGLMSVTGPTGQGPWRAGVAISDTAAGTFLTQGVLAALYTRTRTGKGQWVHTSLLEAMINFMDFQAVRYLNEGDVPGQAGNDHPTLFPMGCYRTADGWLNISGLGPFSRLCDALGLADLTDDERFADEAARRRHREELAAVVESTLLTRTTAEWVDRFTAADLPCGPVLSVDEVFADPQVRHLDLVAAAGNARVLRHPVTLSATPTLVGGPAPVPGSDTTAVIAELAQR